MTFGGVTKGKQERPERILLYGVEGVGKTTFAADAPEPIILPVEDGTKHLDVHRLPQPETWQDVLDAVRLMEGEHPYKTFVVDTVDRAEALLWTHICQRDGKDNIEAYGYGKGYQAAIDEWRLFAAALDRLVTKRGLNVILVAHAWIKTFKNPTGEDFDRYQLKLHDKAAGFLREWSDHVLFAAFEEFAHKKDLKSKTEKAKGTSTGKRLVHTTKSAAFDAKHRGNVPDVLPLSWAAFAQALKSNAPVPPAAMRAQIEADAQGLPEKERGETKAALERVGNDTVKLAALGRWVTAKLAELAQPATTTTTP